MSNIRKEIDGFKAFHLFEKCSKLAHKGLCVARPFLI